MIKNLGKIFLLSLLTVAVCDVASADYFEDFTTNQVSLFQFCSYEQGTNWDFSSDGVAVMVAANGVDECGPDGGDTFGGMGVAPTVPVDLSMVTSIELTARLDAGNTTDLTLAVREVGTPGEFFAYTVPASSFTMGAFTTVSIDPTSGFNGDMTDGILNGMLDNTSIQTPFGSTTDSFFTVQSVNYVMVPEPGSLLTILLGLPLLALRRR